MSIEDAAVVGKDGTVVYWHSPENRSYGFIPDSRKLWDVIWEGRASIDGIAHTHPGRGYPNPSKTDLTTFEAVEKGIGRRIKWWILSADSSVLLEWSDEFSGGYDVTSYMTVEREPGWMAALRARSFPELQAAPA